MASRRALYAPPPSASTDKDCNVYAKDYFTDVKDYYIYTKGCYISTKDSITYDNDRFINAQASFTKLLCP